MQKDRQYRIQELKLLEYIYIAKRTIHIKLKSDIQNQILRLH